MRNLMFAMFALCTLFGAVVNRFNTTDDVLAFKINCAAFVAIALAFCALQLLNIIKPNRY